MKKTLICSFVLLLALGLTACGGAKDEPPDDIAHVQSQDETQKPGEEQKPSPELPDGVYLRPGDTSPENPAPLGQHVEVTFYSTGDNADHASQMRISKITTQSEDPEYIQKCIDDHNNSVEYPDFQGVELGEVPEDIEYVIVDYTMAIPEGTNVGDYGVSSLAPTMIAKNPAGGGIPSDGGSFIGLGTCENLLTQVSDRDGYPAGETHQMRDIFAMVKGYTGYVFSVTTKVDGQPDTNTELQYAYFANR